MHLVRVFLACSSVPSADTSAVADVELALHVRTIECPDGGGAVPVELDVDVALVQVEFCGPSSCLLASADSVSRVDELASARSVYCPGSADRLVLTWLSP